MPELRALLRGGRRDVDDDERAGPAHGGALQAAGHEDGAVDFADELAADEVDASLIFLVDECVDVADEWSALEKLALARDHLELVLQLRVILRKLLRVHADRCNSFFVG